MKTSKTPEIQTPKALKQRSKELIERLAAAARENDPEAEKAYAEAEAERDREQQAIYAAFQKNKKP